MAALTTMPVATALNQQRAASQQQPRALRAAFMAPVRRAGRQAGRAVAPVASAAPLAKSLKVRGRQLTNDRDRVPHGQLSSAGERQKPPSAHQPTTMLCVGGRRGPRTAGGNGPLSLADSMWCATTAAQDDVETRYLTERWVAAGVPPRAPPPLLWRARAARPAGPTPPRLCNAMHCAWRHHP